MKYGLFLVVVVLLSGCLTARTYTIEKARKDTDIQGNRGYLYGIPPAEPKENRLGKTRKISVLEIEFGPRMIREEEAEKDEAREDLVGEEVFLEDTEEKELVAASQTLSEEKYQYYTIQKNDTLQKISHKFYGTTRKWKLIYDTNKEIIKNPDKVYPGTKIKIPIID